MQRAVAILVLLPLAFAACRPGEPDTPERRASAVASLKTPGDGADEGFERADRVLALAFPADHGPHPGFQTEWWYLTANLDDAEGRRYGVQWTVFRRALASSMPERASAWATRQVFLGHFAVTDAAAGRHHAFERLARGAVGLAGADAEPLRVWLEDWSLEAAGAGAAFPWTVRAAARGGDAPDPGPEIAMTLRVEPEKPLVLQGDHGLSRKSSHPGGASYYYSFTRLAAAGELTLDGRTRPVTGTAWLDREWSTSVLAPDQTGWDWFALQLDDGRDLMLYRLRLANGGVDPASSGVLVAADGASASLGVDDVDLAILRRWTSPEGTTYPTAWRLVLARHGLDLEVRAVIADQELDVAFRYWEGAVDVVGRDGSSGRGYVELVGYGD